MKLQTRLLPLVAAISAMSFSMGTWAEPTPEPEVPPPNNEVPVAPQPNEDNANFEKNYNKTDEQQHFSTSRANSYVSLNKELSVTKDVEIEGKVKVEGEILVDASALAIVNDKQSNNLNTIHIGPETEQENQLEVSGDVLNAAQGRVGLNASAGDNNQQDNATAITALTAPEDMNYSADAEVFSYQDQEFNQTRTNDTNNYTSLQDNVLQGAAGDIGVNLATGHNHQQKNNLALSHVFTGTMAEANISAEQYSDHNYIAAVGAYNGVEIGGSVLNGATGNIGVNLTAGIGNQQANHLAIAATTDP